MTLLGGVIMGQEELPPSNTIMSLLKSKGGEVVWYGTMNGVGVGNELTCLLKISKKIYLLSNRSHRLWKK